MLEIDQVREIVMQRYADESFASQNANTNEETEIVSKLRGKRYTPIFTVI